MTKVIARVHLVRLMNVDWAPGGRQTSDQANWLGLWVRRKLAVTYYSHPPSPLLSLLSSYVDTHFNVPRRVQGWVDLGTGVKVRSPCPRLYITAAVELIANVSLSCNAIFKRYKFKINNFDNFQHYPDILPNIIDTARMICGAGSMQRLSVRPSVSPIVQQQQQCVAGGFAAERPAGKRYQEISQQQRRTEQIQAASCWQLRDEAEHKTTCWDSFHGMWTSSDQCATLFSNIATNTRHVTRRRCCATWKLEMYLVAIIVIHDHTVLISLHSKDN